MSPAVALAVVAMAVVVTTLALVVAGLAVKAWVDQLGRRLQDHDESIDGLGTLLQEHLADHVAEPDPEATAWKGGSTPATDYFHGRRTHK